MNEEKPILLDLTKIATGGKLSITLPISGRPFVLKMATARTQMIAQKLADPAKDPIKFMLENIRQCLDPMPTGEEMLDMANPDLDFLQSTYSRLSRTGKNGLKDEELDEFFKTPSPAKS